MSRAVKIFTNNIVLDGKTISSERLLRFLIKCLVKTTFKYSYKLFKLLSSYLSFIFKLKTKELNNKLLNVLNYNLCFNFKPLVHNTQLTNKYIAFVLVNISKLLIRKKQVYVKFLEQSRLLVFYRW